MSNPTIKAIIDGVFLHGKLTPDKSYDLPKGQYTVAEAVEQITKLLEGLRVKKLFKTPPPGFENSDDGTEMYGCGYNDLASEINAKINKLIK